MDLGGPERGPEEVVASNVYHRAFALGPPDRAWPAAGVEASILVNGEPRVSGSPSRDTADLVRAVAGLLDAMGERLRAGDRLIMGSIVQVAVAPGDEVVAELGALGRGAAHDRPVGRDRPHTAQRQMSRSSSSKASP